MKSEAPLPPPPVKVIKSPPLDVSVGTCSFGLGLGIGVGVSVGIFIGVGVVAGVSIKDEALDKDLVPDKPLGESLDALSSTVIKKPLTDVGSLGRVLANNIGVSLLLGLTFVKFTLVSFND